MQRAQLSRYKLPDEPGVYFFKKGRKILYIGKAASLRDRVRSYFAGDLHDTRGPAIVRMVEAAEHIAHQRTDSVLEALMLEANLIKKHQPPYNVESKDNTSFNYVVITNEDFPRVLVVRGRELYQNYGFRKPIYGFTKPKYVFGPFPHGLQLQEALKMIRRIFPYRDRCLPSCQQQGDALLARRRLAACKPCFNRQIGLCPGVCTGEVTKEEYSRTIKHICSLLGGNFKGLRSQLAHDMKAASAAQRYEDAAVLRRQIEALAHIRDVSLIKQERRFSGGGPSRAQAVNGRVEAFDVAHTAGHDTVAVVTVVDNGEALKSAYRKFTIRTATNDDIAALKEALPRRLAHPEWPLPRVFVVDGGKAQVRAAEKILRDVGLVIPVVGVVKDEFHHPKGLIGDRRSIETYEKDILLANSEAHRFGITWHKRRLRNRLTR